MFELKWDGVRALASVAGGIVHLWGRDLQDYTPRYPELSCLRNLPDGTVLDGELVLIRNGRADFHALMARHRSKVGSVPITYIVFDILNCAGRSLLGLPFSERRAILEETVPCTPLVTWCDGIVGTGRVFFEQSIAAGHEGIVAKCLDAIYSPGKRKTAWRKIKQVVDVPCVVIGYRLSAGTVQALLMARLTEGELRYAGADELGVPSTLAFQTTLRRLHRSNPVVHCADRARWVEPRLFCRVRCHGWRPGGRWRDPVALQWEDPAL